MNAQMILSSLSYTSYDYLDDAAACLTNDPSSSAKRRLNIRFSLIVAAIVAIVMIPLTVIIANQYGITPPPIPFTTTPADTHKSLTDIPGAVKVDPENGIAAEISADPISREEKIEQINNPANKRSYFIGSAEFVEAVTISDGKYYWTLMTFDVIVERAIRNIENGESFRVLTYCLSLSPDVNNDPLRHLFPNYGLILLENSRAFFSVYHEVGYYLPLFDGKPVDPTCPPMLDGKPIDLKSYADYLNTRVYETDGEGFYFFGSRIDFSEIIPDPTEESPTPSSAS